MNPELSADDVRPLHRCEARGQEVVGGPLVECQRPGTAHFSPTGLGYWLCYYHAGRFKDHVTPACDNGSGVSAPGAEGAEPGGFAPGQPAAHSDGSPDA